MDSPHGMSPQDPSTAHIIFLTYIPFLSLPPREPLLIPPSAFPIALRRSRPPPARLLPAPRLGHSHTSHSHPSSLCSRRELFERRYDTE